MQVLINLYERIRRGLRSKNAKAIVLAWSIHNQLGNYLIIVLLMPCHAWPKNYIYFIFMIFSFFNLRYLLNYMMVFQLSLIIEVHIYSQLCLLIIILLFCFIV